MTMDTEHIGTINRYSIHL